MQMPECPFKLFPERCVIDPVQRKFCAKHRLEKCFAVGMQANKILSVEQRQRRMQLINQNRQRRMAQLSRIQQHKESNRYYGYHAGHPADPLSSMPSVPMPAPSAYYSSSTLSSNVQNFCDPTLVKPEIEVEPMETMPEMHSGHVPVVHFHQMSTTRSPASPACSDEGSSTFTTEDELNRSYNEKYTPTINKASQPDIQRHHGTNVTHPANNNGNSDSELFDIILAQMLN